MIFEGLNCSIWGFLGRVSPSQTRFWESSYLKDSCVQCLRSQLFWNAVMWFFERMMKMMNYWIRHDIGESSFLLRGRGIINTSLFLVRKLVDSLEKNMEEWKEISRIVKKAKTGIAECG